MKRVVNLLLIFLSNVDKSLLLLIVKELVDYRQFLLLATKIHILDLVQIRLIVLWPTALKHFDLLVLSEQILFQTLKGIILKQLFLSNGIRVFFLKVFIFKAIIAFIHLGICLFVLSKASELLRSGLVFKL